MGVRFAVEDVSCVASLDWMSFTCDQQDQDDNIMLVSLL